MHFQLAGIAGAGIDFADGQRAAEDAEQFVVQALDLALRSVRGRRNGGSVRMPVRKMWRSSGITDQLPNTTG
jgi:hypothetical protein